MEVPDVKERLETYPMLLGSRMHYAYAGKTQADFPGYQERSNAYGTAAIQTIRDTIESPAPQFVDHMRLVATFCLTERMWRAQLEFTEMVLEAGEHCIIGFWATDYPKARTLDTLCSGTINAALLTRDPHKEDFPFHFHYDEVQNKDSELYRYIDAQQEMVDARRDEMRIPRHTSANLSRTLWCIYLLDFTPRDISIVRKKFPQARLIGITTPDKKNDDDAILATMKKFREQQLNDQRQQKQGDQRQQQQGNQRQQSKKTEQKKKE
jgi:hypothetical protein